MNLRAFALLAVVSSMPLSGCILVATTPRASGDVTFLWSFESQGCSMVPSVKNVKIDITGQTLMNGGVFDCSTGGTAGIVLHDFKGGSYSYTIQGRDYNGSVLYTKSSSFVVDGNVTVSPDLTRVGSGGTYALLVWTFPPNSAATNPTCAQAGVDKVNVYVDGASTPTIYNCADGQTAQGIASPYLSVGSHTIFLSAVNAMGYEFYSLSSTLPISSAVTSQQYDLDWAVGGATLHWSVTRNGSTQSSCTAEGITTVYVNFRDNMGNLVYTSPGDPQPCANQSIVYSFLKPGTYSVFLTATGTAGTFESSTGSPPSVTVTSGVFTTMSQGPTVLLNR